MNKNRMATGKLPNASNPGLLSEDDFLNVNNVINLLATAFQHSCPEHANGMCSLGRNPFKCTADCGAIKDFFDYLETNEQ